ncbi:DUF4333 domain-containing protein [Nocardiopsis lambiniae]|uniref:DUF4333 domain-containing protein n=1 Tax=Nocardiopsis lambiniae TaxID=3075539 RepID=A0ABU2MGI0_9ACTN|nr:DUF4333 domain-containing protein [Nocardiopsis sp. DSM 44743]MDT0331346.1 DUF4333 domain-containing protein [Nocardiopsis sp. DSM 44743]
MRQIRTDRIITGAVLGALPLFLATGCSFSIGGPGSVDAEQVAERSSAILAEQVGQTPDDFTCADDLPAEVGAEIRCELTSGGDTLGVTVTVTSVDGNDVQWDIKVDDAPADTGAADDTPTDDTAAGDDSAAQGGNSGTASDGIVPADQVVQRSTAALEAAGHTLENFACSQGLRAEVGNEIRCNFHADNTIYGATITVTSVDGDNVQWDIKVDDEPL